MKLFVSIGSNMGERGKNIKEVILRLKILGRIKCSSLYETAPWGNLKQPDFLNAVCIIETDREILDIFSFIRSIEDALGRKRGEKWGQRTIDIDILFYGDIIMNSSDLIIPHPYIPARRFVLVPLNEIASSFVHPVLKKTVNQMLNECKDEGEVKKWKIGDLSLLRA